MQPVTVTTDVRYRRQEVYDFLDVMANHESFTNHMLTGWKYSGPDRGIGSKACVRASAGGRTDMIEIEVIAAEPPERIVEQNVGAKGRRRATGIYILQELPDGGTRITFEYAWLQAPLLERLAAPIVRSVLLRGNERAIQRLAEQLAKHLTPGSADVDAGPVGKHAGTPGSADVEERVAGPNGGGGRQVSAAGPGEGG